jgi:hypothetical protein
MTAITPNELPPHAKLIQMGRAYIVSRVVYAAAKLESGPIKIPLATNL